MKDIVILLPLFTMGVVSSAHCIGMCGGIMGALTMAIPTAAKAKRGMILVAYNLGRIASYALMGLLAGFFAEQIAALGGAIILRVIAGLLLIAMGLYLADWWRGLTKFEALGRYVWVYIQPLGKRLMPVNNIPKALFLGALWGWLPCGLVYAALAMAMTQPAPFMASAAMLAFGLGTLPAVLAAGFAAQSLMRFLQQRQIRSGLALVVIVFGAWTIWGGLGHSHKQHHDHQHGQPIDGMNHSQMNHSQMNYSNMQQEVIPTIERQRTEVDLKSEHHESLSVSNRVSEQSDDSAVHMHHHEN